jgi:excinuclease ABC subunit A
MKRMPHPIHDGFVHVRGARENNLRDVDVDVPRDVMAVFTGVSGSGKSSLAFGTLYAEAQRRYFESVAPYARRLIRQVGTPRVESIEGLPPAVALQQERAAPSSRSTVGTLTTLSNSLRLLYSRAGTYPRGAPPLAAEAFSPNTPAGACPRCHGLGSAHTVTEASLVHDPSLSIRDGAISAWPGAWQGKNLRDILIALDIDVDRPWRELPKATRRWILFTDEQPIVPVKPGPDRNEYDYNGKFVSAGRHVMQTLAQSPSERMRERALRFVRSAPCPSCRGQRLRPEALAVTFLGRNIAELGGRPLRELHASLRPVALGAAGPVAERGQRSQAASAVAVAIASDLCARIEILLELGVGYLSLSRPTPTLSSGESQRLRIATQLRSGLFGVVYVLDEPSAGLHPADTEPLLLVLERLKAAGNSLFVVEHNLELMRRADWLVDIGPGAGEHGGRVLYSGPVSGLAQIEASATRRFLFPDRASAASASRAGHARTPSGWLRLRGIRANNLSDLDIDIPRSVLTAVTGVSGSGKSTLVSCVLPAALGRESDAPPSSSDSGSPPDNRPKVALRQVEGVDAFQRVVRVDQRPIGRTPRSNLATYTGLFDAVRSVFAATPRARARRWGAGRFSFNVAGGRCDDCQGEGFIAVELIFLPSTYAPCPTCHGTRYNTDTLRVTYRGKSIAEVLDLTVERALGFFEDLPAAARSLQMLHDVGLGYLRLGQPAPELSGGEAQRIKLATELQRKPRGHTLYLLDEPSASLHPADVERLREQLHRLVDAGHSVVIVEHDMRLVASADWIIDLGPGGGDAGGRVVTAGTPSQVARQRNSRTAPYLAKWLA